MNMKCNYRNTRQILQAAYQLPYAFPPKTEEEVDVADPDLSTFNGGKPTVLYCEKDRHIDTIFQLLQHRRQQRVAIVSENEETLKSIKELATSKKIEFHELFRNNDLDYWMKTTDSLSSYLTISRLEAVKGLEFDTVIVADMSHGVIPKHGTPKEEKWREAAIVYVALTRARDELIITFTGHQSEFVDVMKEYVIFESGSNMPFMEKLFKGLDVK